MRKRILVVDDERDLCDILTYNLQAAGCQADAAYSAEEALGMIAATQHAADGYSLILLDVMMPHMSGFELAGQLKRQEPTAAIPIIFLTARDSEEDMLQGFGLGADDYVKKPFSVREVIARVKAVLNRCAADSPHAGDSLICHEGLVLDIDRKQVTVDGQETMLTRTEFELLRLLMSHSGQVLTRHDLLDGAWPKDVIVTDRAVDVNIARMRKKIGSYGRQIVTRQGFGYLFEK